MLYQLKTPQKEIENWCRKKKQESVEQILLFS